MAVIELGTWLASSRKSELFADWDDDVRPALFSPSLMLKKNEQTLLVLLGLRAQSVETALFRSRILRFVWLG
jgi:hypothetical protein